MTKQDALGIIKLLSAIESWGFTVNTRMPDYLHDQLTEAIGILEKIVLEEKK